MEPGEFNEQLEDLTRDALSDGLHPNHVLNILQAQKEDVQEARKEAAPKDNDGDRSHCVANRLGGL